jgi:hypothetical protein
MMGIRAATGAMFLFSVAILASGCNRPSDAPKGNDKTAKSGDKKHEHSGEDHEPGPHNGTMADWGGGKFHVEFVVNHEKKEATVYVLGKDEKTPAPIKAKDGQVLLSIKAPAFQVVLKASPEKSDPEGTSSRFTGVHEKLGKAQEFQGTISAEVDGTPYAGEFKEEAGHHKGKK